MLLDAISEALCRNAWYAYSDLQDQLLVAIHGLNGIENWGEGLSVELDCAPWSVSVLAMKYVMSRTELHIRASGKSFTTVSATTTENENDILSTIAPMTAEILPSFEFVDCQRALRGAKALGWKREAWRAGRRKDARSERWNPLFFIALAIVPSSIGHIERVSYLLSMMMVVMMWYGVEVEETGRKERS
jgi:hypothetical protein